MTEGKGYLERTHPACGLLHFEYMKVRMTRTGARYFHEDLPRSRFWNRHVTEFAWLLKVDKLERFHT